jgi:hypothetical protein
METYKGTAEHLDGPSKDAEIKRMETKSLHRHLIPCILGAVNGSIYSVVVLQVRWLILDYAYKRDLESAEQLHMTPVLMVDPRGNWVVFPCWFILLFTAVSYMAHHYFNKRQKLQPIMLWQIIGIGAVTTWNVIQLTAAWLINSSTGDTLLYNDVTTLLNPLAGPLSLTLAIVVNMIYGAIIQIALSMYSKVKKQ